MASITELMTGVSSSTLTVKLGATLVATQDIFVTTTANADVRIEVLQGLIDPDPTDTTVIIDGVFDMMTLEYLDTEGSNETSIRIDNLEYTSSIEIDDFIMNFELDATDLDGDTFTLEDDLTIAIVDGAVETGLTLNASLLEDGDDGVVLVGGSGPDTIDGGDGDDILIGGGGDDMLSGDTGDDTFVYTSITDGNDVIADFVIADDTVDMDALFDALGVATAELRADDVKITDTGADGVLTVDGVADFSITFTGEDFGGDGTFGQFSAAQLAALGIDVGTL